MTAAGLIFLEQLLSLLGAQKGSEALDYARSYLRITLYGTVFSLLGFGFSHCTRAQGFPMITMIGMIMGAGLNIILDAVFIFVFHWGVEGAAWATVISQAVSMTWILKFSLSKNAVIKLRPKSIRPSLIITLQIISFGSAQFLLQFIMSGVQLLYNTSMGWYGASALGISNGGDIALSGMNIVGATSMLIFMPVFGINQGAQPILGYNYGAQQYNRVFRAYLMAIAAGTAICTLGFVIVQLFPEQIVRIFAPNGSAALMEFAPRAMRTMMLLLPTAGFLIISTNLFVVTGRPKISIFLSMLRQCLVLIPFIFIFGRIWGLWGVVMAAPISDALSLLITGTMIFFELRKLRNAKEQTV
jgi:Na+-driven multidrug efflux pump